jgi:hypothetical protein
MKINSKKYYNAGFMLAVLFLVGICCQATVEAYTVDRTVTVSTSATKLVTPSAVLDNFDNAASINAWGCPAGIFGTNATCALSYVSGSSAYSGKSLKLTYDVSTTNSYAGYYSILGSSNFLKDYKSVSFWVKGAKGGELFKVELKVNLDPADANRDHAMVYVTSCLTGGVSSTQWKKVTIPFDNFANISNWSSAKELAITFENSQSSTNASPLQSAIYIDDITFNTAIPAAVRIGYFDDKVPIDSLGGNILAGASSGGAASAFSFASDTGPSATGKYSLKFDFSGLSNSTQYVYLSLPVGGGLDNWQKISHDFSKYTAISFYIYGSNNLNGVQVELHDFKGQGTGEPFFKIPFGSSTSEQFGSFGKTRKKYTIPFTSFENYSSVAVDPSKIAEVVFSLDFWNTNTTSGTYYIDEIQFE